ncbi:hypothetical protein PMAYCL1PPCAC_16900, partial [Pristionchus mayeri]
AHQYAAILPRQSSLPSPWACSDTPSSEWAHARKPPRSLPEEPARQSRYRPVSVRMPKLRDRLKHPIDDRG